MAYTTAQMVTNVMNAVKKVAVNPDAVQGARIAAYVEMGRTHILGLFRWWFSREGVAFPTDGFGSYADFDAMWFELATAMALMDEGQIQSSSARIQSFDLLVKTSSEILERHG
jgi:hypothetical protein